MCVCIVVAGGILGCEMIQRDTVNGFIECKNL